MNTLTKSIFVFAMLLGVLYSPTVSAQQMQERKVTIQELAKSVETNNIQLKIANSSVQAADARIDEVKTNRLPDIGADMQAMYLSDVGMYDKHWSKIQTVDIPNFGHQFNVTANQLIFAGGKINKSIKLAELGKSLSEHQFRDTDQGVKLNAIELYINLYNLQNQKKILENNKILANERTKTAQYYFEEDMITKNEVLRAEVLERQLEQSILQVQNAILITNKNLTLFAGLDETTLIIPDISNLEHKIQMQAEVFFREEAFNNNPQLNSTTTQIAIAEKNLDLIKSDRLPVLAAFAGYNASRPQTSGVPAMDFYSNTYQVGLNLSYNIESIFKNPKKEAVNKILITQAEEQKEAVRQGIEADVNAAYKNYHQAIEQREVSTINEAAADENYRITELNTITN